MTNKQTYVLSIGINRYQHLGNLSSAAHDAQDLSEVINNSEGLVQNRLLLNEEATKPAILKGLEWLANSAGPEDTAIVFISGHGGRTSVDQNKEICFCAAETSSHEIEQTSLSGSELTAALRAVGSERLVVLIDACYSGGFGEPRSCSTPLTAPLTAKDVNSLLEGKGRVIMAASRPEELAWELAGMRNGVFTHYLLRGLRGEVAQPDGTVWISELFGYVSRSVRQHGRQHPYQKAVGEDFVVVVQPRTAHHDRVVTVSMGGGSVNDRVLRRKMHKAYSRPELSLLCHDLGLSLEDLPGTTLETQIMELIDHCRRHRLDKQLLASIKADRPAELLGR